MEMPFNKINTLEVDEVPPDIQQSRYQDNTWYTFTQNKTISSLYRLSALICILGEGRKGSRKDCLVTVGFGADAAALPAHTSRPQLTWQVTDNNLKLFS